MNFLSQHHRFLFYSSWLVLALSQSASTELIADEAYYWVYSKFPSWGYFDHPPMIAVLIKAGYALFQNELGVRLICAGLSTCTIMITESLTGKKNPFLFYSIVLSIAVLQVAGFFAVPDTPLLFFTALFFYTFRSFIQNSNGKNIVLLALSISLLFYTKYHGLLIVLFAFFSNIKLLRLRPTWIAGFLVLVFYSPHLYWQWQHDWISFRYHLFESNVTAYQFSYTTDYLLGQLLLAGPIAGFILLPAAFIYKPKDRLEKALMFTLTGFYVIFLISSFRGKVEANWTLPVLIPLIVLSHQFISDKQSWMKPLRVIVFISLMLIIAGRLYLAVDLGPDNSFKGRFHNNDLWAKAIHHKAGDTPVVFYNSYQRASLYWFYSGIPSHSHNSYTDRRNNYDFWPTESNLLGRKVFLADVHAINSFSDSLETRKGVIGFTPDTLFAALGGIQIIPSENSLVASGSKIISLQCRASVPYRYGMFLGDVPGLSHEIYAGVFEGKVLVKEIKTGVTAQQLVPGGIIDIPLDLEQIAAGYYSLRLGIKVKNYLVTHNSEKIELLIQ